MQPMNLPLPKTASGQKLDWTFTADFASDIQIRS